MEWILLIVHQPLETSQIAKTSYIAVSSISSPNFELDETHFDDISYNFLGKSEKICVGWITEKILGKGLQLQRRQLSCLIVNDKMCRCSVLSFYSPPGLGLR